MPGRVSCVLFGAALAGLLSFTASADAQTVATGAHFTCAAQNGRAMCWGRNDKGQLGDGTTTNRSQPGPVQGVADVAEVGVGYAHACARTRGGDVYCWGDDRQGQVTGAPSSTHGEFRTAHHISAVVGATDLAVGGFHACAITARGVMCWGLNNKGQTAGRHDATEPARISGLRGATQVVAGMYHSCAITERDLRCWGNNTNGQLGDGSFRDRRRPGAVRGLSRGIVSVAAGRRTTCAVTDSGLQCWGYDPFAEGGEQDETNTTPHSVGFGGVRAVFAGGDTICAILSNGQMACRGGNDHGQAGDGGREPVQYPVVVPGLTGVTEVAPGILHTCARSGAGVHCWGDDSAGQTGRPGNTWSERAVSVTLPGPATSLSVGGRHNCVSLEDGRVACWGLDATGSEVGHHTYVMGIRERPTIIEGLTGVTAVATGGPDTCVIGANGAVRCWGGNLGRLATPTQDPAQFATPHDMRVPAMQSIDVGFGHGCGTTATGAVSCWGMNIDGARASGSTTPTPPNTVDVGFSVSRVFAGGYSTCVLGGEGEASCWGRGRQGQLGSGGAPANRPAPTRVAGPPRWASVSVGEFHGCGVLPNGHIYCWGRGNEGQLGNGAQNSYASPVAVQHLTSATQISVGGKHTCAATNTGRAFCWGLGAHGQLGHENRTSHAAPVAVTGVENVAEVHAGANHTCARTTTGQVFCWGRGHEGELGNGMSHLVRAPTLVSFP